MGSIVPSGGQVVNVGNGPRFDVDVVEVVVVMGPGAVQVNVDPPVVTVVVPESVIGAPVPMTMTPELDTNVCPSGSVVVSPPLDVVEVVEVVVGMGESVKVSPPVVTVVGVVTLGRVMGGLVPITTTPELETTTWPSDLVQLVATGEVVVVDVGGERVNVSPPVVRVVRDETEGRVIGVLVPMITTPELEITVWPSDLVHVVGAPPERPEVGGEGAPDVGDKVNVSPPVVIVVREDTLGRVIGVLVPMITTPELEITVWPSDLVHVVGTALTGRPDVGDKVNVSPPVVRVVKEDTVGRVIGVLVPIITTPELEITVWPSDLVHVVGTTLAGSPAGGDKVNVSPPVVRVVREDTVGRVIGVLVPIITTPELEMTVWPSDLVQLVILGALVAPVPLVSPVPVPLVAPVGRVVLAMDVPKVKVWPPVVKVVKPVGIVKLLVPMTMTEPLDTIVFPFGSVQVVALTTGTVPLMVRVLVDVGGGLGGSEVRLVRVGHVVKEHCGNSIDGDGGSQLVVGSVLPPELHGRENVEVTYLVQVRISVTIT
jgi:hypothetical protein